MALKPLSLEQAERFTALIIGDAGIGKTSLLRTIPESENVCLLSAESGLLCVRDLVKAKRVTGYEITSFNDMKDAFITLNTNKFQEHYKWIFIDSLTEISARCVEAMKAKYPKKTDAFPMWGEYSDLMTQMIKSFRDMPHYNIVFTCLPSTEKDDTNRRYVAPAISGSGLKERLTSYFDEVFYMTSQKNSEGIEERIFITQPIDRYPAKDRSGALELMEQPNLTVIKNKIFTN